MVATTAVEVLGDDAVVVKRVSGGSEVIEALRREGERLQRASHPGVVPVIRSGPAPGGWELVLGYGGRSLATLDRPSVTDTAAIVAGLASTLADLHEIGITHGRIEPAHVLISDRGRPRLCGIGDGTVPAAPEDDVASLGLLLEELLGAEDEPEPIPERRWGSRRPWRVWERRALLLLADQAVADDPSRRPTARRLAAAIAAAIPAAGDLRPPAEHEVADPIEQLGPVSEARRAGATRRAAVPIALAAVGGIVVISAVRPRFDGDVAPPPEVAAPSTDVRVAEPVSASLVVEDGRRYRVGQDGDHLLVADWSCDGRPTPAVFRASSGEVFVFDRWASAEPLAVGPTATVTDGVEMVRDLGRDGCPELSVRTADGGSVAVSLDGLR